MSSDSIPLKCIKPVLIPWVVLVKYLPMQFNFILGGSTLITFFALFLDLIFGFKFQIVSTFLTTLGILILVIPISLYWIFHKTYQLMEYRFFADRLEYSEGFWTVVNKQILYKNITEIYLRKNVIQRYYGLGSLYFAVPSATTGILLVDLPDPDKVYKTVQDILASSQC